MSGVLPVLALQARSGSSVVEEYLDGVTNPKELANCLNKLRKLSDNQINKMNQSVYKQLKGFDLPVFELKCPATEARRFFHIFVYSHDLERDAIVFLYCLSKKSEALKPIDKRQISNALRHYIENKDDVRIIED